MDATHACTRFLFASNEVIAVPVILHDIGIVTLRRATVSNNVKAHGKEVVKHGFLHPDRVVQ